jgi:hypothetical protein
MAWYAETGETWLKRALITVDGSATAAGTVEATVALPSDWGPFWDNVQADGDDIRVVSADGTTKLVYDLNSWVYASKSGNIRVSGFTHPKTNSLSFFWLYFHNDSATDGSGSPTTSSPLTTNVERAAPVATITATPERAGATIVRQTLSKTTNEVQHLWVRFPPLEEYCGSVNSSKIYEEPSHMDVTIEAAGADQSSMKDLPNTTMIECNGRLYAKIVAQGGSDATNYTSVTVLTTTNNRSIDRRVQIKVNDPAEET